MRKPSTSPLVALILAMPLTLIAQGTQEGASFSGTWKLTNSDPPVQAGRGGRGGGGISGPYAETTFAQAPERITISQSASDVTVQVGPAKAVFTLDGTTVATP